MRVAHPHGVVVEDCSPNDRQIIAAGALFIGIVVLLIWAFLAWASVATAPSQFKSIPVVRSELDKLFAAAGIEHLPVDSIQYHATKVSNPMEPAYFDGPLMGTWHYVVVDVPADRAFELFDLCGFTPTELKDVVQDDGYFDDSLPPSWMPMRGDRLRVAHRSVEASLPGDDIRLSVKEGALSNGLHRFYICLAIIEEGELSSY